MFSVPNCYRIRDGLLPSDDSYGNNGAFLLPPVGPSDRRLYIIASDGAGWEHVSVHANDGKRNRTPTWEEMCRAKDAFWGPEDVVVQYHPRRSQYVNEHAHTLHLWRPTLGHGMPEPPSILVGRKAGE